MYKSLFILSISFHLLIAQTFSDVATDMNVLFQSNTSFNFGPNGVSFYDFNNDGWDDITFTQETDSQVFYMNNEGTFEKIPSFIYSTGETKQVLWVDYDNDGDNDILVSMLYGQIKLFQNDGDFNFTDVSAQAGLSPVTAQNYGVSFGDYDKDGFLDLYVCRYTGGGDPNDLTQVNNLYHNNGDGTFTNVTFQAGVADGIQPSFLAVWIDYNKDTWPDLYVINDRSGWGNSLYHNNGDGTFTNLANETNAEVFGQDPMTATAGDFDNDGDLDIYMSNTALFPGPEQKRGMFLVNKINETNSFKEEAAQYQVDIAHYSWGATWVDFNNDTYQDLYVTTARFSPTEAIVRAYFYVNDETEVFIDSPSIFQGNHVSRSFAVAKGDIDNDGYADLVVSNAAPRNAFLWKNTGANNNYIKITLEGTYSNKMAIGSWIYVYAGGNRYTHYTMCGENFVSQNSQNHIFGLGSYNVVDSIIVEYPSGLVDKYFDMNVNEHYYFTEGETFAPQITVLGNTVFCEGDSVILDAGEFLSYTWSNGSSDRFLTVKESGVYNVLVENLQDSFFLSNSVQVSVMSPPVIEAITQEINCFNTNDASIQLNIETEAQNYEVEWQNGELGNMLENLSPGNYSYTYIDEFGCVLEDFFFFENPQPLNIQSLVQNETGTTLGSISLQINGGTAPYTILINGDSTQNPIQQLGSGIYEVEIFDLNACSNQLEVNLMKDTIEQIPLSISLIDENTMFKVYPNPLSNRETINIETGNIQEDLSIILLNILGQKLWETRLDANGQNTHSLKLPNLEKGLFILEVRGQFFYKDFKIDVH